MSILVVMEQRSGEWNRMSWEALAAGQQLAAAMNTTVSAAVLGQGLDAAAAELAGKQITRAYAVEHDLLQEYTPDAWAAALRQAIAHSGASLVLFPHTYQVRDFLPKLATSLGKVAVSDVVAHRIENGQVVLVRQLFQGKVYAGSRIEPMATTVAGEEPEMAANSAHAITAASPSPPYQ